MGVVNQPLEPADPAATNRLGIGLLNQGRAAEALEVFEVFASGTLADEVYVLEDVGGKRIAIAPAALKAKYRKE